MLKKRIAGRLDVKNDYVIKGIHLEGLRKIGDPNDLARKYFLAGIDEIIFMDAVASYYDRNSLLSIIKRATSEVFVPITVGGGIRSIEDIRGALRAGADKVAVNTQAIRTPRFITDGALVFGSQCMVASIEAKKKSPGKWEAYYDNGREPSGLDVVEWAAEVERLGAGEILLTSIDQEGTKKGFDNELAALVSQSVEIPVILSGGCGRTEHLTEALKNIDLSGIAIASAIHYEQLEVIEVKRTLREHGIEVRL